MSFPKKGKFFPKQNGYGRSDPENGFADAFLPVSIQTERDGGYTNFKGVVSTFKACFPKAAGVSDAETIFAALAGAREGRP